VSRPMSLVFTFELTVDDTKHRITNYPGDALRLRSTGASSMSLDERLQAGGTEAYAVLFEFAWQAMRHLDGYASLTLDEFMDRCTDWAMVPEETIPPTVAGPSSAP
jgi:hypothetical protein